ncbi:MAG TPA: hypothetical protein ENK37_08000 [Oceanithermus profundus]|uniref:Lipoprotein n=1 Tax=Oceanithermus profundus TaxID=187137 RepID=A0A7C4Z6F2_9DEIN|nr:hypothetical protein [Oceanithermus profundus]
MQMKRAMLLALLLVLGACVPQKPEPAPEPFAREQGPVDFYPHNIGLYWIYLPQTDPPTYPTFKLSVLGPGQWDTTPAVQMRFVGRGQERIYFRRFSEAGVELLGFKEQITLTRVSFDPPMLEYPPPELLRPGYRWGGSTTTESVFLLPGGTQEQAALKIDYSYEVKGKSRVEVPAGVFEAYVIELTVTDDGGNTTLQEIWFVPHVGEVRTREGLVLIEKNF